MATYTPPGWPAGVHPPGSDDFESTAVGWLLDVVPPDYRLHGVLRRYPVALATMARYHSRACVEGARQGYRTARTELAGALPPHAVDTVLAAYRKEGARLAATARAVGLVERALRGEVFTPKMSPSTTAASAGSPSADSHKPTAQPMADAEPTANPKAAGPKAAGPKAAGPKTTGPKPAARRRRNAESRATEGRRSEEGRSGAGGPARQRKAAPRTGGEFSWPRERNDPGQDVRRCHQASRGRTADLRAARGK